MNNKKKKYYCIEENCNNIVYKKGNRCKHCFQNGSLNSFWGKKHTKKAKNKISKKNTGEERNKEFKLKRSNIYKKSGNPSYTDGRTYNIYYCKEENCNNKICYQTFYFGNGRCKSCAKKGKLNINFGKIPINSHGKRQKYKKIWMRSSYEIKYAKYLDKNKIQWKYESKTFDLRITTYTPDFYLPKNNEYIEIKGYWRDKAKKKFELFKKLYPKIKIKVLKLENLKDMEVL